MVIKLSLRLNNRA